MNLNTVAERPGSLSGTTRVPGASGHTPPPAGRFAAPSLRALALLCLWPFSLQAQVQSLDVPLRLDFGLIEKLLQQQVYTDVDGTAQLWRDADGCNYLTLWNPEVAEADGKVRTRSRGSGRIGTAIGDTCIGMINWKGTVELFLEPILFSGDPVVHFRLIDSHIYDEKGQKGLTTGFLWDRVKRHVHPRFNQLRVDMTPVLNDVHALLPVVLPRHEAGQIEQSLESLAILQAEATPEGLGMHLHFEIPELAAAPEPFVGPQPPLTPEELAQWDSAWQQWDGFLTFLIRHAAADTPLFELRIALRDVLLDARHDLQEALIATEPGFGDPVPELFMRAWEELAAVLRRIGDGLPGEAALRYLSFINAADALQAINRLGPATGFEISADALRRLARIVAPQATADPLEYSLEVDAELRTLLGFGPPLPLPEASQEPELLLWFFRSAVADDGVDKSLVRRLNLWVPGPADVAAYLPLVRDLLDQTAQRAGRPLQRTYHALYQRLVLAAAWQESCWRQFVKRRGEVVPLRSSAGAVGLMQVMPAVWRGFYDTKGLAGDIGYNAAAGSEILRHYLTDYAIARSEHKITGSVDNLARATYAAYNGGPRHLTRYRRSGTTASLRRIDAAFWKKYQTIRQGDVLAVAECFSITLSAADGGK